jgi:3-dehydroquinate synthetase/shikimate kinase
VASNALGRHLALVGFMGAGKSTLGPVLAKRLGREFVSVDAVVEERVGTSVADVFATRGESAFRELEEGAAFDVLSRRPPAVVELGGGALGSMRTQGALAEHAFTLHLEVTAEEAWTRVAASDRPLARDREAFTALHGERARLYADADARAEDLESSLLAAAGIRFAPHTEARGDAVVADVRAAEAQGIPAAHLVENKTLAEAERLWEGLRIDRSSTLVAVGGGTTTDLVGFVAATYMRGVDWVAVPSTLVGQVDAAIGGKVGIDIGQGKNLVGAFHWPVATVIDTSLLETLAEEELRNGLAEVVKTGLLAGEALWELDTEEQVRRCAAFKAAVCLRDPRERGERAHLNLGHTFAHALEAASDYTVPHGHAVALGLTAALRLSDLDDAARTVEDVLAPARVAVDRERAWVALQRDKKAVGGRIRLVLLVRPGEPLVTSDVEPDRVRSALDALIA